MATLSTQTIDNDGLDPAYAAASAGGDKFTPSSRAFLHVKNGDGSSHTVTIATTATVDGLAVADVAVAVPAGDDRLIGPLKASLYADSADSGLGAITYAAVTSMTVAVIAVGQ